MKAIFINEHKIKRYNGKYIIVGNTVITNPTTQQLTDAGYKEVVCDEFPQISDETQGLEYYYEDGEVITEKYRVYELPQMQNDEQDNPQTAEPNGESNPPNGEQVDEL